MSGKPVVIPLNPDQLTDAERRQALEATNIIKGKKQWYHQGKNLHKRKQEKKVFEIGRKCGITNGISIGIINNTCDQCILRERNSHIWRSRSVFSCGYTKG